MRRRVPLTLTFRAAVAHPAPLVTSSTRAAGAANAYCASPPRLHTQNGTIICPVTYGGYCVHSDLGPCECTTVLLPPPLLSCHAPALRPNLSPLSLARGARARVRAHTHTPGEATREVTKRGAERSSNMFPWPSGCVRAVRVRGW